jgi:DnaJ domain
MAAIPPFLDGLGPARLVPKLLLERVAQLTLSPEAGFVLSRVDGRTSLGEILMLVPFERATTISLLQRLWLDGALDLPGMARPEPKVKPASPSMEKVKPISPSDGKVKSVSLSESGVQLADEQIRRIDEFLDGIEKRDAFQLLEVARGADDKEIKRAYFRLSKEFHPDRHFGKELGEYRARLSKIFLAVKAAFELLSDKDRRAAYEESAGNK